MDRKKWMAETGGEPLGVEEEKEAQDYLSKLAQSILAKEKPKNRPQAAAAPPSPDARRGPLTAKTPIPRTVGPSRPMAPAPAPERRDWQRQVELQDEAGRYLPGTILVFEDGSVGVYKEFNPAKDYDIIYQLMESGRAVPQGIPMSNYEVEPIGRLSQMCLDQITTHNKWDRDMIVFHLLKFKDIAHVPKIDPQSYQDRGSASQTAVPRPVESQVRESSAAARLPKPEQLEEKPLTRGRRLTIDFGPNRRWDAVYWGKDELGHVVAHNTHDRWSLMHLDLARFKDSVQQGDMASELEIEQMQKDFAGH